MKLALLAALGVAAYGQAFVGTAVCAQCHAEIAARYGKTGMARSSGRVGTGEFIEALPAGEFREGGAAYRVWREGSRLLVSFARAGRGEKELTWFVGSGKVGRSYAFREEEFLFQAPVSYYSSAAKWDVSPGYRGNKEVDFSKPVEEACFACHATRTRVMAGTRNGYEEPPFAEAGIGCERCHGAGEAHVRGVRERKGAAGIVNPAKLEPARRASVCEQCHLSGAVRVAVPGKQYRPGDLLSESMAVFVWEGGRPGLRTASDHAEQLSMSACRRTAGDKMWCGSCHDAHGGDTAAKMRTACLNCHETRTCNESAARREARLDDCAACHMTKSRSAEGEHVAYTDHRILRLPAAQRGGGRAGELRAYWPGGAGARATALAYAGEGDARALGMLQRLEAGDDAAVLAQLAQIYDARGDGVKAVALYERVLRMQPRHLVAAANLGVYRAKEGNPAEAARLWDGVFSRDPGLVGPGMNLAALYLNAGRKADAVKVLRRVLRFHPDMVAAIEMLREVEGRR